MASAPFDPYRDWLGIEPHELPADHYRLLGLARFEADPARITSAADERMALVRSFQTGPRGASTQKLLNELATARVCLQNAQSKAAYDAALANRLSAYEAQRRMMAMQATLDAPQSGADRPVESQWLGRRGARQRSAPAAWQG